MAKLLESRRIWLIVVLALLATAASASIYRWFNPPWRVEITITDVDPSCHALWLVVETDEGPESLWWSLEAMIGLITMHPNHCNATDFRARREGSEAVRDVVWKEGVRYAVMTWDKDDNWRVFWFDARDVHLEGRLWILGGGKVRLRLPGKESWETASPDLLDRVGFGPDRRKKWREYYPK